MPILFRHFYRMVFFLVLALTTGGEAIAQSPNFPVRASVTIVNPSPYLEDYGRDGNMLVVLTLVDNQPNYQGLLRVTIEGNGYRAETRDLLAQAPISLNFGAPVILRGPDLAAYFNLNNLNVQGIATDNSVGNGGALPDGPISICVEVYDINRFTDPPVSNPACAIRFVQQNYPPELVRPLGQVTLPSTQTAPMQRLGLGRDLDLSGEGALAPSVSVLNFSWNPRHIPQPADDEYVLEVWKKVPGLTNDQIIRSVGRSRQPIITRLPRYTYTNYDSRLEIGAQYIWRVQVRDRRGVRQFVNDGFSSPGEFSYGTIPQEEVECVGADVLFAANVTDTEATISWENPTATTSNGYSVRYRPTGQGSWTDAGSAPITATTFPLTGLSPETDYEVEVCAVCKDSGECTSIPFTTMEEELIDCGPLPDPSTFAITNNSLRVIWDHIPQAAGYVLTWKKLPNPGDPVQAQEQTINTATDNVATDGAPVGGGGNNNGPAANPFRIELPAGATEAVTNNNLEAGYTYRLKLCKSCLDGREECTEWEVPFNGYVDYCSEDVEPNVAVVSGSESQNNMDLGWTYSGMNVLPQGYDLRLVYHPTADASVPDTTGLAGTMTGTTVTGLSVGTDYTFELCVVCPDGEERCATTTGTTDPFSCPDPAELETAVIVTPVIPDGIMVDWSELGPATDPAGWSFALLDIAGDTLQRAVAETGYQTTFTNLDAETEYRVVICHRCPVAEERQCAEETIFLPGCEAAELALAEGTVHFDFVELSWTDVGAEQYTVTFSEQGGEPLAEPQTTAETDFRLGGLRPTTTYEISVCFECGAEPVCDTIVVTTIGVNCALAGDYEYDFECGVNVSLQNPENQQLVESLNPGDSIWAGDFLVEIAEITGNTTFGGFGRTKIPYLKNAKLRLDFHEIQVNEDCRMVAGKMVIKSPLEAALEQLQQGLQDLEDILGDIDDFLGSISNTLGTISTVLDQIATAADVTAEANAVLDQLVTALDQVPYLPDSYVDAVEDAAECLRLAALSGDDEAVRNCRDQLQQAIQNAQDYIDDLFDADFIVDFSPTVPATAYWGLDSQRYDLVTEGYDQRTIGGTPYKVPWASTSTEAPAGVPFGAVRRDNGTMQPVNFIGSDTQPYPGWTKEGTSASNSGLSAGGNQEVRVVFAAHDNPDAEEGNDSIPPVKLAGQLNLITYTPVRHTVHIVPINNAALAQDAGQVEEALNRIYRPAVAEWTVVVEPNIDVTDFAGTLQDIPNSLLSNYTPQMKSLKNAVQGQAYYDGDHYYLLVVPRMAEPDRLGFMPRKRSFGFLTAERLTDGAAFNRAVAHELGHGAFHLQHVWDRFEGLTAGSTDNLMDSGGGETLFKYQWDNVHDPESNFTLFDDEGEGESILLFSDISDFSDLSAGDDCIGSFYFNSAGIIFEVDPAKIKGISFASESHTSAPKGAVTSFFYLINESYKKYIGIKRGPNITGYYERYDFYQKTGNTGSGLGLSLDEDKWFTPVSIQSSAEVYWSDSSEGCDAPVYRSTLSGVQSTSLEGILLSTLPLPEVSEIPEEDVLQDCANPLCVDNGPGKDFFDRVLNFRESYTEQELLQLKNVAVKMNLLGKNLMEQYTQNAWADQSELYLYFYDNYASWDYSIADLQSAVDSYYDYVENIKQELTDLEWDNTTQKEKLVFVISRLTNLEMADLSAEARSKALQCLIVDGLTSPKLWGFIQPGADTEGLAIRLIQTMPENQIVKCLDDYFIQYKIWKNLDKGFSDIEVYFLKDGNYTNFTKAILAKLEIIRVAPSDVTALGGNVNKYIQIPKSQIFRDAEDNIVTCSPVLSSEWVNGKLRFKLRNITGFNLELDICTYENQYSSEINPGDYIVIQSTEAWVVGDQVVLEAGKEKIIPAYLLHFYLEENSNEATALIIEVGVDVALALTGIGELAAGSRLVRSVALIDFIITGADVLGKISRKTVIENYPVDDEGKKFMDSYGKVCSALGIVSMVSSGAVGAMSDVMTTDGKKFTDFVDAHHEQPSSMGLSSVEATELKRFSDDLKLRLDGSLLASLTGWNPNQLSAKELVDNLLSSNKIRVREVEAELQFEYIDPQGDVHVLSNANIDGDGVGSFQTIASTNNTTAGEEIAEIRPDGSATVNKKSDGSHHLVQCGCISGYSIVEVRGKGQIRIEEIETGDYVLSRSSNQEGYQEVKKVTRSSSSTITSYQRENEVLITSSGHQLFKPRSGVESEDGVDYILDKTIPTYNLGFEANATFYYVFAGKTTYLSASSVDCHIFLNNKLGYSTDESQAIIDALGDEDLVMDYANYLLDVRTNDASLWNILRPGSSNASISSKLWNGLRTSNPSILRADRMTQLIDKMNAYEGVVDFSNIGQRISDAGEANYFSTLSWRGNLDFTKVFAGDPSIRHALPVPDGQNFVDDIMDGYPTTGTPVEIDPSIESGLSAAPATGTDSWDLPTNKYTTFRGTEVLTESFVEANVGTVLKNIDNKLFFVELDESVSITRYITAEDRLLSDYWGIKNLNAASGSSPPTALYEQLRKDLAVLPEWNKGDLYVEIPVNDMPGGKKIYGWFGKVGNQPVSAQLGIDDQYFAGGGYQIFIPKWTLHDASFSPTDIGQTLTDRMPSHITTTNFD